MPGKQHHSKQSLGSSERSLEFDGPGGFPDGGSRVGLPVRVVPRSDESSKGLVFSGALYWIVGGPCGCETAGIGAWGFVLCGAAMSAGCQ